MNLEEFEKKTKKYLKERSIQPSKEYWNQLETALDKKPKNRSSYYIWGSVAAACVAAILLSGKMYFTKSTSPENPGNLQLENVVTTPSIFNEQKQNSSKILTSDSLISSRKTNKVSNLNNKKTFDNTFQNQKASISLTTNKTKQKPSISKAGNMEKDKLVELKSEGKKAPPISTLAEKGTKPKTLSPEEEADILLREALYKEFLTHIEHEKDSAQMVAYGEELLKEASLNLEKEEDRAFRKKVKEVIQKNWSKAKSALVDASPYK